MRGLGQGGTRGRRGAVQKGCARHVMPVEWCALGKHIHVCSSLEHSHVVKYQSLGSRLLAAFDNLRSTLDSRYEHVNYDVT